ncbi:MAG: hypothetical protein AAGG68_29950 [Bacteroidota bacterium]
MAEKSYNQLIKELINSSSTYQADLVEIVFFVPSYEAEFNQIRLVANFYRIDLAHREIILSNIESINKEWETSKSFFNKLLVTDEK